MEKVVWLLLLALYGTSAAPAQDDNINIPVISAVYKARDGQFPFMVSIQRRFEVQSSRKNVCGGALITLQHVLTAASCLYDTISGHPQLINVEHFRVFAGHINLANDNDENRVRLISNYTMHPDFMNNNEHVNDIAILTLNSPFIANSRISPLSLPSPYSRPNETTSQCTVAGWGQTRPDGDMSTELQYATMSLLPQPDCETQYPALFNSPNVTSSMVCGAATSNLTYGCPGDEGNPLICNTQDLVGIMFKSNRCGISRDPVLYTRVSNYTDWATSIIDIGTSSSSTFQPFVAMVFFLSIAQMVTSKFNH